MDFEPQVISPVPPPPSSFVNALGWILILCGSCSACVTILKNIIFPPFLSKEELTEAMQQSSLIAKIMFSHSEYIFLSGLILSIAMLVVGIGLLKRKNWARIITIVMVALGILFYAAILVLLFTLFSEMINVLGGEAGAGEIQKLLNFIQVFGTVLTGFFLVFHIFIIKKLCSAKIKEEFLKINELILSKSWE